MPHEKLLTTLSVGATEAGRVGAGFIFKKLKLTQHYFLCAHVPVCMYVLGRACRGQRKTNRKKSVLSYL